MNLTKIVGAWQRKQDELIAAHNHTLTVYYNEEISGQSTGFDSFFGESTDPANPDDRTGVTATTGIPYVVTGIASINPHATIEQYGTVLFPLGQFETGAMVFTCKLSDAVVSGVNKFEKVKYIEISIDPGNKYQVIAQQKEGLVTPYVVHVALRRTNIESN